MISTRTTYLTLPTHLLTCVFSCNSEKCLERMIKQKSLASSSVVLLGVICFCYFYFIFVHTKILTLWGYKRINKYQHESKKNYQKTVLHVKLSTDDNSFFAIVFFFFFFFFLSGLIFYVPRIKITIVLFFYLFIYTLWMGLKI